MRLTFNVFTVIGLLFAVLTVQAERAPLDELMATWLSLESQKGHVQKNWSERQQQLDEKISLFDAEKTALEKVIESAGNVRNDVDVKRMELARAQEKLEQEQVLVSASIAKASTTLQLMAKRLPPPLQQEWVAKMALLGEENVSNSEKLERLLQLLQSAEEFNSRVAMHRSVIEAAITDTETQKVVVNQMYLGVNQAWYVSDDATVYGYGRSTILGWQWWQGRDASKELGRTLEVDDIVALKNMLETPTAAAYLSLPIKL
ncbi:DUF3450 family protein [Teredinibacter purpureus]|uniref:DUF3450 family protein n=1 Tax=Teredinibacter purpureus TaxID=2731756 RepID=UPI000A79C673|nr:DUF3450 family protein [Teredinibacter purpureus]